MAKVSIEERVLRIEKHLRLDRMYPEPKPEKKPEKDEKLNAAGK